MSCNLSLSVNLLKVSVPTDLLWALIGLILTIGGTFLEAHMASAPWSWSQQGFQAQSLGVTYQIGAGLLIGCLGGKNAAAISQIAYLLIGLTPLFPVFSYGGGPNYVYQPSFGYLVGFIPGAWVCGLLAFRFLPRLEGLALSCLAGLLTIHGVGLLYLVLGTSVFSWLTAAAPSLPAAILTYSVYPIPGQLAVVCAVTVLSFILRHLLFY